MKKTTTKAKRQRSKKGDDKPLNVSTMQGDDKPDTSPNEIHGLEVIIFTTKKKRRKRRKKEKF